MISHAHSTAIDTLSKQLSEIPRIEQRSNIETPVTCPFRIKDREERTDSPILHTYVYTYAKDDRETSEGLNGSEFAGDFESRGAANFHEAGEYLVS